MNYLRNKIRNKYELRSGRGAYFVNEWYLIRTRNPYQLPFFVLIRLIRTLCFGRDIMDYDLIRLIRNMYSKSLF